MADINSYDEVSKKLSVLIAIELKKSEDLNMTDKVRLLTNFNLSNDEIANIIGATKGTVEVTKSRIKGKKNGK